MVRSPIRTAGLDDSQHPGNVAPVARMWCEHGDRALLGRSSHPVPPQGSGTGDLRPSANMEARRDQALALTELAGEARVEPGRQSLPSAPANMARDLVVRDPRGEELCPGGEPTLPPQ
jgi:hypothetical protein